MTKPSQNNTSSENSGTTQSCVDAIKAYRSEFAKNNTATGDAIKKGDQITVHYIGSLADGTVFDTSVESVAKACDKYNEGRNYTEGLSFAVQGGNMIPGFDNAVVGMKIGEQKTVTIPAAEAYGERDPNAIQKVPLKDLPPKEDGSAYVSGDVLYSMYGEFPIVGISGDMISVDVNHQLAGKELIFDIFVTGNTKATAGTGQK